MKNIIFTVILPFIFVSCGFYQRNIIIQRDFDKVKKAVHSVLQKTDFSYSERNNNDSWNEIDFSKFMEGYGRYTIKKAEKTNSTFVNIKFTTGNYDDATWIFEQILLQEMYMRENPAFRVKSNLKRKSVLSFCLLNTASPFFSFPYLFYNNPYYGTFNKYFITASYGLFDTLFIYNSLNPDYSSQTRNFSLGILILWRSMIYIGGILDIPYYNHLVDSGYHINRGKSVEESLNIPVFFKRL